MRLRWLAIGRTTWLYVAIAALGVHWAVLKVLRWNQLTQPQLWLQFLRLFDDPNSQSFRLEVVKTIVSSIGTIATIIVGFAVFLNFYLARKNTKLAQDNTRIAESRLLAELFSKAVEQLSHKEIAVRLGGIYTLEKIARDSPFDYHWTVMEVLISFVRENTSSRKQKSQPLFQESISQPKITQDQPKPDPDIQAILTVIGRRSYKQRQSEEDQRLDLRQYGSVKPKTR